MIVMKNIYLPTSVATVLVIDRALMLQYAQCDSHHVLWHIGPPTELQPKPHIPLSEGPVAPEHEVSRPRKPRSQLY